jgi:hypothetical protein
MAFPAAQLLHHVQGHDLHRADRGGLERGV